MFVERVSRSEVWGRNPIEEAWRVGHGSSIKFKERLRYLALGQRQKMSLTRGSPLENYCQEECKIQLSQV